MSGNVSSSSHCQNPNNEIGSEENFNISPRSNEDGSPDHSPGVTSRAEKYEKLEYEAEGEWGEIEADHVMSIN